MLPRPKYQALPPDYLFPVGVFNTQCVSPFGVGGILLPIPIDRVSLGLPTGCHTPPCGQLSPVFALVPAGSIKFPFQKTSPRLVTLPEMGMVIRKSTP